EAPRARRKRSGAWRALQVVVRRCVEHATKLGPIFRCCRENRSDLRIRLGELATVMTVTVSAQAMLVGARRRILPAALMSSGRGMRCLLEQRLARDRVDGAGEEGAEHQQHYDQPSHAIEVQ